MNDIATPCQTEEEYFSECEFYEFSENELWGDIWES